MSKPVLLAVVSLIFLLSLPVSSLMAEEDFEETYTFERMWPTLQHPWYFSKPKDVAADRDGYVYISDSGSHSVQKFTRDGQFVAKWKIEPWKIGGKRIIPEIAGIAVDDKGYVYVTDTYGIQKFDSDGQFKQKWRYEEKEGSEGYSRVPGIAVDNEDFVYVFIPEKRQILKFTTDGQVVKKDWNIKGSAEEVSDEGIYSDIAVDNKGFIYVADTERSRIQKFDTTGEFQKKWSLSSGEDGTTALPSGVAVDEAGFVYVTNAADRNILKFTSEGDPVENWRNENSGKEYFYDIAGITANREGFLYVADWNYHCIHKLTSDTGRFIVKWGSFGNGNQEFHRPFGVTIDHINKHVYVADTENKRILKFSMEGKFEGKWESWKNDGKEDTFAWPYGMAVDSQGFVYVADINKDRILKFDSDGNFVRWASSDIEQEAFDGPSDVAIGEDDSIYVTDTQNDLVWKFNPDGSFNQKWEGFKETFSQPSGVAVHKGIIYVTDTENSRIQKRNADGSSEMWGTFGFSGNGVFANPVGVTVDNDGFVYVSDPLTHRIQKFGPDGSFVTSLGESGSGLGQLNSPTYLCTDTNGSVYVADTLNNRIQVFRQTDSSEGISKAIIIAGGGPYPGNNLWNATRMSASYAYRVLNYQGFGKDDIYYLTADTELDLDGDGEPDVAKLDLDGDGEPDINGEATKNNFYQIISHILNQSEEEDIKNIVVYLVNHGGEKIFRMNETQILSAYKLRSELKKFADKISGTIFVVYDACESGTFHSSLKKLTEGKHIVITSTSDKESAYFMAQGSVSFSGFFWTNIFNGDDLKNAFKQARKAVKRATESEQIPLMYPSDNDQTDEIFLGSGTQMNWEGPEIYGTPSEYSVNSSSARLYAKVRDNDGDTVDHVWAMIIPPSYGDRESSGNPVLEFPCVDLAYNGNEGRYEAAYDQFNIQGTYQVIIHARDSNGNTSVLKSPIKVSVGEPMIRRAIIVAGESQSHMPVIKKNAEMAYNALKMQYYTDDAIYLMATEAFLTGVETEMPSPDNLHDVIERWANQENTYDLVLYLVGNGKPGKFHMNEDEALSVTDLDKWLDDFQAGIPGKVTVIYDADYSGSFISSLTSPQDKDRIVISGTSGDQPAIFSSQDAISFSAFFWKSISNGVNVRDAFLNARNALNFFSSSRYKTSRLDDNGNGTANERSDGQIAMNYTIGAGIRMVRDETIAKAAEPIELNRGETSATIKVKNMTTSGTIKSIWGVVIPPNYNSCEVNESAAGLQKFSLSKDRYEGICEECFNAFGTYQVLIYAEDSSGNISLCQKIPVYQSAGQDSYEQDDDFSRASFFLSGDKPHQHNFYDGDESDWVMFYGIAGKTYTIETRNREEGCDVFIEVYAADGVTLEADGRNTTDWRCPEDKEGFYYVKLSSSGSCSDTRYDLQIYLPEATELTGTLTCIVTDTDSGKKIENAKFMIDNTEVPAYTPPNKNKESYLIIPHVVGASKIKVEAVGYESPAPNEIFISNGGITPDIYFELRRKYHTADTDRDDDIDFDELNRVIQLYNAGGYHCNDTGIDGFAPNEDGVVYTEYDYNCIPHNSDYDDQNTGCRKDWIIDLSELLRAIEFYNTGGYRTDPTGVDGFAPAK
ncbi:SMP-30/gluconolactonase/LRE family protein [Desulfonema magnum]|nr:C13 family peptidase [Desulfonema magnum]